MGWQSPDNQHWRGDVGRLIVNADTTLTLESDLPFMSTDEIDPISLSYPWVLKNGNNGYDMWYGSTKTWDSGNGEMIHVINSAHSHDGNNWHRNGLAIPFEVGVAQAFSRPTVAKNNLGGLEMWFSYRSGTGDTYRIGYATTDGGTQWRLALEEAGIDVSPDGWDSEMIEYPFVFDHKHNRYMLYNGNSYGKNRFWSRCTGEALMANAFNYIYILATIAFTVYGQLILKWRISKLGPLPVEPIEKNKNFFTLTVIGPGNFFRASQQGSWHHWPGWRR
nr:hypothetical protein GCM10020185_08520 [Pseudomonas brassicacearum subsp. brassicacearum]